MANEENLKPFKKGNDPRRNITGNNRKTISSVLAELKSKGYEPVTKIQVAATYQTLTVLPQEELTEIANDKHQPMLNRIIAKAILGGKGFENIEKMLDRAQGRATQSTDLTSGGEKLEGLIVVKDNSADDSIK